MALTIPSLLPPPSPSTVLRWPSCAMSWPSPPPRFPVVPYHAPSFPPACRHDPLVRGCHRHAASVCAPTGPSRRRPVVSCAAAQHPACAASLARRCCPSPVAGSSCGPVPPLAASVVLLLVVCRATVGLRLRHLQSSMKTLRRRSCRVLFQYSEFTKTYG